MKNWHIGRNTLYKKASLYVEEGPWWVFFLMNVSQLVCHYIPEIPFPPIGKIVISKEDEEFFDEKVYNWRNYWGDISQWWHSYIDDPVYFWLYKKIKRHTIKIPYNRHRTISKEFNIKWQ